MSASCRVPCDIRSAREAVIGREGGRPTKRYRFEDKDAEEELEESEATEGAVEGAAEMGGVIVEPVVVYPEIIS